MAGRGYPRRKDWILHTGNDAFARRRSGVRGDHLRVVVVAVRVSMLVATAVVERRGIALVARAQVSAVNVVAIERERPQRRVRRVAGVVGRAIPATYTTQLATHNATCNVHSGGWTEWPHGQLMYGHTHKQIPSVNGTVRRASAAALPARVP